MGLARSGKDQVTGSVYAGERERVQCIVQIAHSYRRVVNVSGRRFTALRTRIRIHFP